jgi:hypothetical protein
MFRADVLSTTFERGAISNSCESPASTLWAGFAIDLCRHEPGALPISMQMGGGTLATALRWLAAFALLRASLVLLNLLKLEFFLGTISPINQLINYVFDIGWQVVPWTLAFAATCRAEMTVTAARELRERRAARGALASV